MSLGRVLVVDDEADVRQSLKMTLKKAGFDVVEAEDGEKAIKAIKSGDNPIMVDTILCDIFMPKVNGIEAIDFFRKQFPSVPVIVITGKPEPRSVSGFFKQGVVDYLVKPIDPQELVYAVKKAVKEHDFFKNQSAT
jgi:two-component system chemotaxis response regulator CheY